MGDPWASPLEEPSFIKELDNLVGCEDLQNQQQPLEENISSRRLQHASPPSSKTLKTPLPEPAQPSKSGKVKNISHFRVRVFSYHRATIKI